MYNMHHHKNKTKQQQKQKRTNEPTNSLVHSWGVFGELGEDDPGRVNGSGWQREEGGNAERTGRDWRRNWRWRREVRVTAAIKGSE